jgi:hypothetical protein
MGDLPSHCVPPKVLCTAADIAPRHRDGIDAAHLIRQYTAFHSPSPQRRFRPIVTPACLVAVVPWLCIVMGYE